MTRTQIESQGFRFDATFINADVKLNPEFIPVKYSVFDYIEILDNITNPALSGYAILNNYNDLLNSSSIFKFGKTYNNFFNFRVEQIINVNESIKFDNTFVLNDIHTLPYTDVVDKLIVKFDDIFFGTLRNKTVTKQEQTLRYKQGRTSDIVRNIFNDYSNENIIDDEWIDSSGTVDLHIDPTTSIHDIFALAYALTFTTASGTIEDCVCNVLKDNGNIFDRTKSNLRFEPINKRFLDLYRNINSNQLLNLTDSVIEGIAESGASPIDTKTGLIKGFSEAEMVQYFEPDPTITRDLFRNIIVSHTDNSNVSEIAVIPIIQSLSNFYRLFCNNPNFKLDIPFDIAEATDETNRADPVKYEAYFPSLEPGLVQAKLYNTILMNSKLITFQIKGQCYRQPGYFIYFQPRHRNDAHYRKYVGFWYVVEVKHIFKGNSYTNLVTCINPFIQTN